MSRFWEAKRIIELHEMLSGLMTVSTWLVSIIIIGVNAMSIERTRPHALSVDIHRLNN
jgi:hypothetical protein